MISKMRIAGWMLALISLAAPAAAGAGSLNLIPMPAVVEQTPGAFTLATGATIRIPPRDAEARRDAEYLASLIRSQTGADLKVVTSGKGDITLRYSSDGAAESYRLKVASNGVVIDAHDGAGLFYGAVTLAQLVERNGAAPDLSITDAPRLRWRGVLLDSARHYQSPVWIKCFIDEIARRKLNVLHWHLTDDQAWRLEIRRYPKLTSVGGWRVDAGEAAAADIDPATGKPRLTGGVYTQAEVREIVAYAAARHVTIVPEIEMPGHATAAIAAYPELGAGVAPAGPSHDWGVFANLYNVDEPTFTFLENVLTEVMDLFPGKFIHVGGDEALKTEWKTNPAVQARIKALGVKDEAALQSWFINRIGVFLARHGRRAIGWDEILEGGLPPSAAVMSWHGISGGIAAAKAGHDAVLTPVLPLYLDYRQSDAPDEPAGRALFPTKLIYDFDPLPPTLASETRTHILGVQANIWTEHMRTEAQVDYMAFPRLSAVAEMAWTPQARRDWTGFVARLPKDLQRLKADGIIGADSVLKLRTRDTYDPVKHQMVVALYNQAGYGDIRYTMDWTEPTAASALYKGPLTLNLPSRLRAGVFSGDQLIAPLLDRPLTPLSPFERVSQTLKLCSNRLLLNMEDDAPLTGPRAVFLVDIMNPCWIYPGAELGGDTLLKAGVGRLPFNFQVGDDVKAIPMPHPATPEGELEVRIDGCDRPPVLTIPLKAAAANPAVSDVTGRLDGVTGRHDLCFTFTRPTIDPFWALASVALIPASPMQ